MVNKEESADHSAKDKELSEYHIALIEEGVRQADRGELIDHSEVEEIRRKIRRD